MRARFERFPGMEEIPRVDRPIERGEQAGPMTAKFDVVIGGGWPRCLPRRSLLAYAFSNSGNLAEILPKSFYIALQIPSQI